jgi:hypothetical protein
MVTTKTAIGARVFSSVVQPQFVQSSLIFQVASLEVWYE